LRVYFVQLRIAFILIGECDAVIRWSESATL